MVHPLLSLSQYDEGEGKAYTPGIRQAGGGMLFSASKSASDISVKVKVVSIERLPWIGSRPAF